MYYIFVMIFITYLFLHGKTYKFNLFFFIHWVGDFSLYFRNANASGFRYSEIIGVFLFHVLFELK